MVWRTGGALATPAFPPIPGTVAPDEWVVYAQPPFGGPLPVIEYLGRYTHRVALSNDRLVALQDGQVTFQYKDYRRSGRQKSRRMTLEAEEFIRRFLLHVLPAKYQRIRSFGFLANRHRKPKLALCRQLLSHSATQLLPQPAQCAPLLASSSPRASLPLCPNCGRGQMTRIQKLSPYRWPARPPDTS